MSQISTILQQVCQDERVNLPPEFAAKIAAASERNLRRALLMLEASKVQAYAPDPFSHPSTRNRGQPRANSRSDVLRSGPGGMTPTQSVARADWQNFISQLAAEIVQEQSPQRLLQCRSKFYELLTNCIPPEVRNKRHLFIWRFSCNLCDFSLQRSGLFVLIGSGVLRSVAGDPEAALDGVAGEPGRLLTTFLAGLRSHTERPGCVPRAKSDQALVVDICKEAAFYEHRIRKGQKPIFHLEAFAAKCAPQPCSSQLRGPC